MPAADLLDSAVTVDATDRAWIRRDPARFVAAGNIRCGPTKGTEVKLHVEESGEGDRVVVLIHGFNCDAGDWWQLAPILVEKGYQVRALDLRGHGKSPRADRYLLSDFAEDVAETVGEKPEVIMGHSLGALVAGRVVEHLRPTRAIYLDPAWSPVQELDTAALFPPLDTIATLSDEELAAVLHNDFPRWSERAVQADVASWRRWDPTMVQYLDGWLEEQMPDSPFVPSLVVVAEPSVVMRAAEQERAASLGFEVRVADGLSHSLFRDDLDTFLRTVHGWL